MYLNYSIIQYNFETSRLEWKDGSAITKPELKQLVDRSNALVRAEFIKRFPGTDSARGIGAAQVGGATLKRAAFVAALVQRAGRQGSEILEEITRQPDQQLDDLKDVLYSRASDVADIFTGKPKRVTTLADRDVMRNKPNGFGSVDPLLV